MSLDIPKEINSNQTTLLLMSGVEYNTVMVDVLKGLKGKRICYVTTNKTLDGLKESFKKGKAVTKEVVFVDAISKSLKKVEDSADQVYYVSNPGALTELSLVLEKFLKYDFDCLIFDSITNLNVYNKTPLCVKFINSLISKIKKANTKGIFYAVGEKSDELPKHLSALMDNVIEA